MTTLVGVLDNIRSCYNVGAMFRTADGLGVSKLYLCGITPRPDRETDRISIAKTALGAEQSVLWTGRGEATEQLRQLKADGFLIVALETDVNGISLDTTFRIPNSRDKLALVVGHEVYGIHHAVLRLADVIAEIPLHGTKRSLNVEVAFAIGTYVLMHSSSTR